MSQIHISNGFLYSGLVQNVMGSNITIGKSKEEVKSNTSPLHGSTLNTSPSNNQNNSLSTCLQELKKLRDDGLISQEVYDQRQKEILENSN